MDHVPTSQALLDLVQKFEENIMLLDGSRSGRPTVFKDIVIEMHYIVTPQYVQSARDEIYAFDAPKTIVL